MVLKSYKSTTVVNYTALV